MSVPVNKFEQVSSDDHQMSVAGGRSPGLMFAGGNNGISYGDRNLTVQHKIAILKNKQNVIITFHLLHVITILINKESIIITFQDMGDLSTDTTL